MVDFTDRTGETDITTAIMAVAITDGVTITTATTVEVITAMEIMAIGTADPGRQGTRSRANLRWMSNGNIG